MQPPGSLLLPPMSLRLGADQAHSPMSHMPAHGASRQDAVTPVPPRMVPGLPGMPPTAQTHSSVPKPGYPSHNQSDSDDGLPMPGEPLTSGPKKNTKGKGSRGLGKDPQSKKKQQDSKDNLKKKAVAAKPDKKDNRGGRVTGSRNFSPEEMVRLVAIVGEVLPLGQNGWATVEKRFSALASRNDIPRDQKALKAKFDAVRFRLFVAHR